MTRTKKALEELMARELSELHVAASMVGVVNFAEHCCVVALAVKIDGIKVPVGLWLGDTENKRKVTHLLADLVDGGLSADDGLLVVIDGAKPWPRRSWQGLRRPGAGAETHPAPLTTCPRPAGLG